jgi:hypothetical protein
MFACTDLLVITMTDTVTISTEYTILVLPMCDFVTLRFIVLTKQNRILNLEM